MPYKVILNLIIVVAFVFAFIKAENKGKLILATIMALIIIFPKVVNMTLFNWVWWMYYISKLVFGLCCLIYIKFNRFGSS